LELAEYCEAELEKNPLLERDEPEAERQAEAPESPAEPADESLAREDFSKLAEMDASARENIFDAEPEGVGKEPQPPLMDWSGVKGGRGQGEGEDQWESTAVRARSLKTHLEEQVAIAAFTAADRLIAVALIDAIDEAGYLATDPAEIARRLGVEVEDVEAVLGAVQGFDPVGVGARNLAECLSLQLTARDRLDPAMAALLTRLDLLARRELSALGELCGVDADDVVDMIAEIRRLNPKPGLAFGSEPVASVIADVFVRAGPDGDWLVELNSETLPRLLVNSRYYAEISRTARDRHAKTYLSDCFNNANWLVKSLDQRARTILKVASEIVRQQDGFLAHGVRHLRPLNLRTVAEAIGMHESTVSRVTANKYIATPRGLFELKYFFTASIQSMTGLESHSAEAVRDRIREMIGKEEIREILSDDRIVSLLTAQGVNIARRTVAKYREAMHIPSSVERRRFKAGP
ncbi:MAG: RNA polymerase factor sigma-54, partial [Rhizomicrobium sp.]